MTAKLATIPAPLRLVLLLMLAALAVAVTVMATRHGGTPHTGAMHGAAPSMFYQG